MTGVRDISYARGMLLVDRSEDFRPPRPLRTAALMLAPLPLPLALWLSGALPAAAALGACVSFVLLALVQGGLGAYDLHRSRGLGDALLRAYPGRPPVSELAAWRAAELTSARKRRELRRLVRRLRRETEACSPPGVWPAALAETLRLLRRLESRLDRLTEPVSPLGMLDVHLLATDDLSPLYFPERTGALPAALSRALAALDPA